MALGELAELHSQALRVVLGGICDGAERLEGGVVAPGGLDGRNDERLREGTGSNRAEGVLVFSQLGEYGLVGAGGRCIVEEADGFCARAAACEKNEIAFPGGGVVAPLGESGFEVASGGLGSPVAAMVVGTNQVPDARLGFERIQPGKHGFGFLRSSLGGEQVGGELNGLHGWRLLEDPSTDRLCFVRHAVAPVKLGQHEICRILPVLWRMRLQQKRDGAIDLVLGGEYGGRTTPVVFGYRRIAQHIFNVLASSIRLTAKLRDAGQLEADGIGFRRYLQGIGEAVLGAFVVVESFERGCQQDVALGLGGRVPDDIVQERDGFGSAFFGGIGQKEPARPRHSPPHGIVAGLFFHALDHAFDEARILPGGP